MEHIAQSTFAQYPAASGLDLSLEIIVCTPYSNIAEYQGTRAALEAEGVIPADIEWPEGFKDLHWNDDQFRYWLCRKRPNSIKGPRQQFLDIDWWMFRRDPLNAKPIGVRIVEEKAKELADTIYRCSPQGEAAWFAQWDRYQQSTKDVAFQAFKALIPGLIQPKRGRRTKNADQTKGQSA